MTDTPLKEDHDLLMEPRVFWSQTSPGLFGRDLYLGFRAWPVWITLGWNDIALRYRRSVLGPLWMTLSMSVLVVTLGFIYSRIFHMEIETYLPYLALGFVVWTFISSAINESCAAFQEGEGIIKQIKVPFSVFVLRVVWRNFIVLMHTIIVFIPIAIFFKFAPRLTTILVLPGLAVLYINLVWIGLVLAVFSTRFRDVPQIIATILQIAMFATPILWSVSSLGERTLIADINPLFHFIELVRAPLTGGPPAAVSWIVSIGSAVVGTLAAVLLLRRVSRRIVYWL
jgi:ABC-type polysaccharide/polyol phosphate export permease